jgi:ring-1,2-phenylacetyl-CoA epoxidase subunit PaaC
VSEQPFPAKPETAISGSVHGSSSLRDAELLLEIADDELVLGWRDSEWTGIAPMLEEDVALSSIAQNEIGHARAIFQLLVSRSGAGEAGTSAPGHAPSSLRMQDADALAFDRPPEEYRCSPLVELRFIPDWARTIARRVLYEAADELRLEVLKASADEHVAGLAAKIDREEVYHRMHAGMWLERLRDEERFETALTELWPYALGAVHPDLRAALASRVELDEVESVERGSHVDDWPDLWDEMTVVRRSVPGATW